MPSITARLRLFRPSHFRTYTAIEAVYRAPIIHIGLFTGACSNRPVFPTEPASRNAPPTDAEVCPSPLRRRMPGGGVRLLPTPRRAAAPPRAILERSPVTLADLERVSRWVNWCGGDLNTRSLGDPRRMATKRP